MYEFFLKNVEYIQISTGWQCAITGIVELSNNTTSACGSGTGSTKNEAYAMAQKNLEIRIAQIVRVNRDRSSYTYSSSYSSSGSSHSSGGHGNFFLPIFSVPLGIAIYVVSLPYLNPLIQSILLFVQQLTSFFSGHTNNSFIYNAISMIGALLLMFLVLVFVLGMCFYYIGGWLLWILIIDNFCKRMFEK